MSSDVMIVCKELDTHFEGKNYEQAIFIDEASMGCAWSEFGKWLSEYMLKLRTKKLDGYDINEMIKAVKSKETHEGFSDKEFFKKVEELRDRKIFIECW